MATGAKAPSLTIDDAFEVLGKLGASRLESLILVGEQAAAFWIAKYEIADPRRVTTKDIDVFLSERRPGVAVECAKDLSGELLIVKEPRVPDVARVRFSVGGVELQIDFLRSLHGVAASDLMSSKLGIIDERASGKVLYVMHPVLALASRLFNTFELPGRLTEENLSRLRFSIEAVRAYLTDQLSTEAATRQDVLPSINAFMAWPFIEPALLHGLNTRSICFVVSRNGRTSLDVRRALWKSVTLRCSAWSKGSGALALNDA
jgi:hypothetical protein